MPTTAVEQEIPVEHRARFDAYDDRELRVALRWRGVRFFEAASMFFNPALLDQRPELRPVDASGRPMERFGWYVGLCPSDPAYLAERCERIEEVVERLDPDGVFLGWIRFPSFWELWLPETTRGEIIEYCFCERCLGRFEAERGVDLGQGSIADRARLLQHELRDEWTEWKCELIAGVVQSVKEAARRRRPDVEVMINGLPFRRADYENAVEEVCGQRIEALSRDADLIELMFYHQILRREPAELVSSAIGEARGRTSRALLATLQLKPDYLEPPYEAGRRNPTIVTEELTSAIEAAAGSGADGIMLYHWSDLLELEASGDTRLTQALLAFKESA